MKKVFLAVSFLLSCNAFAQSAFTPLDRSEPEGYYNESVSFTKEQLNTAWNRSEPEGYYNDSISFTKEQLNTAWNRSE